jgi:hypothetical protein
VHTTATDAPRFPPTPADPTPEAAPVETPPHASTSPPTRPAAAPAPLTWAERWLGVAATSSWPVEGQRLVLAIGLAALFGVSVGLRRGGVTIALAALGAPAGIAAVAFVAVPAFAIVLSLANAPVDVMDLARATSRAAMRAGLFLAGLAPGAALIVVTVEEAFTVTVSAFGALVLAGMIASHSFSRDLRHQLAAAPRGTRAVLSLAMPAFLLFAAVLAVRVWWLAMPVLTEVP